ncbi:arginine--tRNA ligase, partial [Candidatus Woesebacteria bacterium RIFOXYA1_FULL_43_9]
KAESEGVLEKSEGAVIFPGEKYDLHSRVFVTSEGVPTYEAKDLGLAKLQFGEHNPDLIVHVVAPEQAGYFQVLFKALELIQPETKGREFHLQYGWVRLKEGKMSSRLGNVILGEDLLDEAKKRIIEKYKTEAETAEKIAVGAIKYSFLKTGISQEIAFDMDESISLDGNSGPYLQYTAARAMSVLRKAEITNYKLQITNLNEEERALLRHLVHYPEMVEEAAARFAPNLLCEYLYQLASKFNTFYNIHRILNSNKHRILESEKSRGDLMKLDVNFRLSLTSAVAQVLSSGLSLLGIEAPERM